MQYFEGNNNSKTFNGYHGLDPTLTPWSKKKVTFSRKLNFAVKFFFF